MFRRICSNASFELIVQSTVRRCSSQNGWQSSAKTSTHVAKSRDRDKSSSDSSTDPKANTKSPSNYVPNPIVKISLSESVPGLPEPTYAKPVLASRETDVTVLENGLRVASERKFGSYCTVGVLLDSGSRYEGTYPSGITHFLEKLAFGNTVNRSRNEISESFEKLGGIIDCQGSRDTLIYATSVESTNLEQAVDILSEITQRPLITDEEVKEARQAIAFDLEGLNMKPEKDVPMMEMIHAAAFRDNTLGFPKICPSTNIDVIDRNTLFTYIKHHHTPSRMVLAGVGVQHELLVEFAQKYFVERKPIWEEDATLKALRPKLVVDASHAQYTGGIVQQEADLSDVSIGPNPFPDLVHFVIGLNSVGHQHPDFVTYCVLNMMMGGGGSFSAGGPGKGMYTRLYTNVLNRYHWMYNATALNHSYMDTGVFCIQASAHPSYLADMAQLVVRALTGMSGSVGEEEFNRAKIQLQSMLLMNLESRPVVFEDVGRQVLATGKRLQPGYFIEKIKNITVDDIIRVSNNMLRSKPSVAVMGNLKELPHFKDIEAGLLDSDGKMPTKSRLSLLR